MSEREMDVAESAWTTANLLKLVGRIRINTPESEKTTSYQSGLLSVNWDKTAFPPYSAKECHDKWQKVMKKMRKVRSLPDLIAEAEEVVSKPLLHRRTHPDFPKYPCSPRIDYMKKNFSRLKKKHPRLAMTEIVVKALKKYNELPDEKKDEYKKRHALERAKYLRKLDNFCKNNNLHCTRRSRKAKLAAIEGLPVKPPRGALSLFIKEHAAEKPSLGSDFSSNMKKRWRKLDATEKHEYYTRCLKMRHEYNAKLKEYLDRFDETEKQLFIKEQEIRFMKAKPLSVQRMSPREPKMPSQTLLTYFARDKRMSLARSKKLWHELPVKEKERYKEQMHSNMEQYSENLQKWFEKLTPEEQTKYLKQKPSKLRFLDGKKKQVYDREELHLSQPSDSEDEEIIEISSEEDIWSSYEGESGEDWDMFERHR
ncbi:nucleolar transcription factor 1-A-like isoform X2 [Xiphophorus couchianus]|uniref:nucleolar transcription factor 1-A-like isoform X2 n=1 Tax=Xiphophorus couchianus TaxID=32473 RepID=UPI001015FDAC|nr:nucleolar transcription factor 1-A-like isoform X2 [Xiphophorus couchianus]